MLLVHLFNDPEWFASNGGVAFEFETWILAMDTQKMGEIEWSKRFGIVSSKYILDSSNCSSFTFWTSLFASSSRSNWTGIWSGYSNGSWTDEHSVRQKILV